MLAAEENKLLACVHCGLCLEACPTYVHTGDENDSPRGRIYLMRAVEEGRLAASSNAFETHINRCLGCRACEQACPAGVEYGQLLEAARSDLSKTTSQGKRRFTTRLLRFSLRHVWLHRVRLRVAFAAMRLFRNTRVPKLLIKSRLARIFSRRAEFALALLDSSLGRPRVPKTKCVEVIQDSPQTPVLLFKGCVTEGLFARVNRATARVLEINGCKVQSPESQVCCGALHAHAGELDGARQLARRNIDAFSDGQESAIVTNAGGCGAMLVSYAHLLADDPPYVEAARKFSSRVRDVSEQLHSTGIRKGSPIDDVVISYDASCHLLYGQRAGDAPLEMLQAVAGLKFAPLAGSEVCCGAAGVYNLMEPELSGRVLGEKLGHIRETFARTLTTGNPGCHMQIGAGAKLDGMELSICHPVELLDESYERAGLYE